MDAGVHEETKCLKKPTQSQSLTWHKTDVGVCVAIENQAQKITSSAPKLQRPTPLTFHQTQPHGFRAWANPNTTGVLYLKLAELIELDRVPLGYSERDPFHGNTEGNT